MPAQMPIAVGTCLARERRHDDRERERVHERRADALHGARRDQLVSLVESAQAADESVKMARPTRNILLRPKRSPSFPPSRISAANERK